MIPRSLRAAGVTLIELTIVIVLAAILSVIAMQFGNPIKAYIDTSRRADLSDAADTALRRIGRDVHLALPNSVRVDGTGKFLEFMQVRTGGRYRSDSDPAATETCPSSPAADVLSFSAADTCFKSIGDVPNISEIVIGGAATQGDFLVVFNLAPGTPNADAYEFPGTGGNKSKLDAAPTRTPTAGPPYDGARFTFDSNSFAYESPGKRFFIVEGPVTYACDTTSGTLRRYWGYTISATQPTSFSTGSSAILINGVTGCTFTYSSSVTSQGAGLVTMALQVTVQTTGGGSESVNLYHAVHVNNVP